MWLCPKCKQTKSEHGECWICKGTASIYWQVPEIRPDWTWKDGMRTLRPPSPAKPKKPPRDTREQSRQEVLTVLKALEDGERSYLQLRQATGLSSTRTTAAALTARDEGWLTERWEPRENEPLGRSYFYAITEDGREQLTKPKLEPAK